MVPNCVGKLRRLMSAMLLCPAVCCFPAADVRTDTDFDYESLTDLYEEWEESELLDQAEEHLEQLEWRLAHPLDLNRATDADLATLPFLNPSQVEKLAYYLYRNRPLSDVSQLLLVGDWDETVYRRVKPFVCVLAPDPKEATPGRSSWKKGRLSGKIRTGGCLQKKAGYVADDSLRAISKAYLGGPLAAAVQGEYTFPDGTALGLQAERDAGERGVDYVSAHLYRSTPGYTLVVGDFHVLMGQGLLAAQNSFGGKQLSLSRSLPRERFLSPHRSFSESGFCRGAGIEASPRQLPLKIGAFVSCQRESSRREDSVFRSLKTDGLFRTVSERECRRSLWHQAAGLRASFTLGNRGDWSGIRLGVNALYNRYGASCEPEWKPYNSYSFRGRQSFGLSADWTTVWRRAFLSGEMAVDARGHPAALANLFLQPHSLVDVCLSGRWVPAAYQAPASSSQVGGGLRGGAGNEWYVQVESRLIPHWQMMAYADFREYPWLRYGVNAPSEATEFRLRLLWTPALESLPGLSVTLDGRQKTRWSNGESETGIRPIEASLCRQGRLTLSYENEAWRFRLLLDGNRCRPLSETLVQGESWTGGWSVAREIRWKPESPLPELTAQAVTFNAENYANRISLYSPDVAGGMPFSTLYGRGRRLTLLVKTSLSPHLKLTVRVGHTQYDDRETIGSGLETIQGRKITQAAVLLSIK